MAAEICLIVNIFLAMPSLRSARPRSGGQDLGNAQKLRSNRYCTSTRGVELSSFAFGSHGGGVRLSTNNGGHTYRQTNVDYALFGSTILYY